MKYEFSRSKPTFTPKKLQIKDKKLKIWNPDPYMYRLFQ